MSARYPGKRFCYSKLCVCVLPPRPDNEIKRKKHDEVMPLPVPDFSPCDFRLYEGNNLTLTTDFFCSEKLVSSLETDNKTGHLPESVTNCLKQIWSMWDLHFFLHQETQANPRLECRLLVVPRSLADGNSTLRPQIQWWRSFSVEDKNKLSEDFQEDIWKSWVQSKNFLYNQPIQNLFFGTADAQHMHSMAGSSREAFVRRFSICLRRLFGL